MSEHKILCIDDDPFYRDFYKTVFLTKGMEVETAENLSKGLKKALKLKPDLMLLDIMLPESEGIFDGYGLLQELRKHDETKDTPVIMISALDQTGDQQRGLDKGANTYIPKQELTPDRLLETAEKMMASKTG